MRRRSRRPSTTLRARGKQFVDHGEGSSSCFERKKKNNRRRGDDNLVAAVERKATRPESNPPKANPPKDHFEKVLEAPCTHHEVPVKHTLKDCYLMENYINNTLKPKAADPQKKASPLPDDDAEA
jgi:hypothetical protein